VSVLVQAHCLPLFWSIIALLEASSSVNSSPRGSPSALRAALQEQRPGLVDLCKFADPACCLKATSIRLHVIPQVYKHVARAACSAAACSGHLFAYIV
jgi:hypothetical protein